MKLSILLSLPVGLRIACAQLVDETQPYRGVFDGSSLDQESLLSICPDYTRYAVLQQ